jgi:hypothetical protein
LKPTKLIDKTANKAVVKKVQKRLREMGNKPSRTIEVRDEEHTIIEIVE